MAVASDLVEQLVCPRTRQPVALAGDSLVERVNRAIAKGALHDVGGAPVDRPVEALLVREDGEVAYAVRSDIPEMLADRALPLSSLGA